MFQEAVNTVRAKSDLNITRTICNWLVGAWNNFTQK